MLPAISRTRRRSTPTDGLKLVGANAVANLTAVFVVAAITLLVMPFYLRWLGADAFGLVGFYLTLSFINAFVDMGLGVALGRELALIGNGRDAGDVRSFAIICQFIYWGLSIASGAAIFFLARLIGRYWLSEARLPQGVVWHAVQWMGIALALQLPRNLYVKGLKGLQRQIAAGLATSIGAAFRSILGIGALLVWPGNVVGFFISQVVASCIETPILGVLMWSFIPKPAARMTLSIGSFWARRRFIFGIGSGQLCSALLTYADRLVVSIVLPLDQLGYYILATSLAAIANRASSAWLEAIFPRTVHLTSSRQWGKVGDFYHLSTQILVVLVAPITALLALYAKDILFLWTKNSGAATAAAGPLVVLAVATGFNATIVLAHNLQLASGWSKLGSVTNALILVLFPPLLFVTTERLGLIGAALPFLGLQLVEFGAFIGIMHRYLLRGHLLQWYVFDIAVPAIAAVAIVWIGREAMPQELTGLRLATWLAASGAGATIATALCCSELRTQVAIFLENQKVKIWHG